MCSSKVFNQMLKEICYSRQRTSAMLLMASLNAPGNLAATSQHQGLLGGSCKCAYGLQDEYTLAATWQATKLHPCQVLLGQYHVQPVGLCDFCMAECFFHSA